MMIPRLMERLARLEASVAPPSTGKHLAFKVEAPKGMPVGEIAAFLRERGHAIDDTDDVLVMNLGVHGVTEGAPIRDLSPVLLTEAARAAAPAGGKWPKGLTSFTFHLDGPRGAR